MAICALNGWITLKLLHEKRGDAPYNFGELNPLYTAA
jgi:hypothetical protein